MVLAEVPLWVVHGSADAIHSISSSSIAGANASRLPGMLPPLNSNSNSNISTLPNSNNSNDDDALLHAQTATATHAAKSALSLLQSTRGGSNRAPMYSVDVHPDGTRFATAAGDGTVRIWSMAGLFGGSLAAALRGDNDNNNNNDDNNNNNKKKKKKKNAMPSSCFTDNGNYVSSNTEDYDYESSSSSASLSSSLKQPPTDNRNAMSASNTATAADANLGSQSAPPGVNDLSGLVRKKKGGMTVTSSPNRALASSATAATINNGSYSMNATQPLTSQSIAVNSNTINIDTATATNNNNNNNANSATNNNKPIKKNQSSKLLTTISSHEGSVLSLRFSPSGTYLASAGDDSYINIYKRCSSPSLASVGNLVGVDSHGNSSLGMGRGGGNGAAGGGGGGGASGSSGSGKGGGVGCDDVEYWNRIAICRGHHLDVVGLAWAPDDSHLVSCSLDSVHPVIVWKLYDVLGGDSENAAGGGASGGGGFGASGNAGGMGATSIGGSSTVHIHNLHPFKVLGRNTHTSTVKGVAFDPAGKYIATSGDDPAICIWRAFDDWGLEARIDSTSGVFRSKKRKRKIAVDAALQGGNNNNSNMEEEEEDDPGELASLSLFRRISFAPDGSHVCGTNATLRGKNIAAMISREGWAASGPRMDENGGCGGERGEKPAQPPGAANLVGHKQPVVSSRHCPIFFQVPSKPQRRGGSSNSSSDEDSTEPEEESDDDPDAEPEYATLVALGDKRGFVTVWSTKSSRPVFKMQCSESRCTVTDISWGLVRSQDGKAKDGISGSKDSLVMIVSLLDGYVVALHFAVPDEVGGGRILSEEKHRRIFRLKYGIDDFVGMYGSLPGKRHLAKRLVDDAGPMLIENALQMTMEMDDATDDDDESSSSRSIKGKTKIDQPNQSFGGNDLTTTSNIKDKQVESLSTKSGKKRIRPVLMTEHGAVTPAASNAGNSVSDEDVTGDGKKKRKKSKDKSPDLIQNALDVAGKATSIAEGAGSKNKDKAVGNSENVDSAQSTAVASDSACGPVRAQLTASMGMAVRIPHNTNKVHTVDLTTKPKLTNLMSPLEGASQQVVADCTNSTGASVGGTFTSLQYATLSISRGGCREWKDIIPKTTCTSLAANDQLMAAGTADGCLYLYGTSPALGWESGKAFRAFPPFILGSPVVEINFGLSNDSASTSSNPSEMIVVTSDGNFYVYQLLTSGPKLGYKGTIVPPMQHMCLASASPDQRGLNSSMQPKLARIQITESNHLMLILMLPTSSGRTLQGFVYHRDMELWMRVSDSNSFLLSDFYSTLPGLPNKNGKPHQNGDLGILAKMDKVVRSGGSTMASAKQMYHKVSDNEKLTSQKVVTRSHCEDRLACSIALGSASEFEVWLSLYARSLSSAGDADALRFLVDILLGCPTSNDPVAQDPSKQTQSCWWFMSVGNQGLGFNSKRIIRKAILPEMSKNRLLQRLSNEISMELESL